MDENSTRVPPGPALSKCNGSWVVAPSLRGGVFCSNIDGQVWEGAQDVLEVLESGPPRGANDNYSGGGDTINVP